MAWARGERQVCSMVRPPGPEEEDARRLTRERATLVTERVRHVNRIKGMLANQGVFVFEPTRKDRRKRVEQLRRWDGQPLPPRLKAQLLRELDRLELIISQIATLEAERDQILQANQAQTEGATRRASAEPGVISAPGPLLLRLSSIGPQFASVLALGAFYRSSAIGVRSPLIPG